MGTSTSYRSPPKPRWNGFVAALLGDLPVDRVRSELFNAGNEWQEALADAAIASFASSAAELYESFRDRIANTDRPDLVLGQIVVEARDLSAAVGFTPAIGVAERAFLRTIITTLGGIPAPGEAADQIDARWASGRGASPIDVTSRFAGELLGQFARHAVDREAGRLAVNGRGSESASLSERIAVACADIARAAAAANLAGGVTAESWSSTVNQAFEDGRAIPGVGL